MGRKETREATKERHAEMRCVVRELKISAPKLSKRKKKLLRDLFTMSKYCYNHYLEQHKSGTKWSEINTKPTAVPVKTPDGYENRGVGVVPAQVKQSLLDRMKANFKSMIENVKNGNNAASELHFTSRVNSIPLKQFGTTYKLDAYRSRIHIANIGWMRCRGWKQLEELGPHVEYANANLVRRASGYYLQVTMYVPYAEDDYFNREDAGCDFGVSFDLTLDDGTVFHYEFEETNALKEAQRKNQVYRDWTEKTGGKAVNSNRQKKVLAREYEKVGNQKKDARNKACHYILTNYGLIFIQDDDFSKWAADGYGQHVSRSILGGVKEKLLESFRTVKVDRFVRTTGVCSECGHVMPEKLPLSVREWTCPECGAHHFRDVEAAEVIKMLGRFDLAGFPVVPGRFKDNVLELLEPIDDEFLSALEAGGFVLSPGVRCGFVREQL